MYWHSYMQRNTFISWIYECLMQTFFKQNTCGLNTAKQNNAMQCAWYKIYYNLFTLWWKLRADVLKVPTHQLNLSPPTINHFISTKDGNVKVNKTFSFFFFWSLKFLDCGINMRLRPRLVDLITSKFSDANKIKTKIVAFMHLCEYKNRTI